MKRETFKLYIYTNRYIVNAVSNDLQRFSHIISCSQIIPINVK